MLEAQQIDELLCVVSSLDRNALIRQFHAYRADFPVDFTAQFLNTVPIERLRHIFVAMCVQCQKVPDLASTLCA